MMLMWSLQTYANSTLVDTLEKSTTIYLSVRVKEPVCQIVVPESVDFGESDVMQVSGIGIESDFTITLKNCTQHIPKPGLAFRGEYIDTSGMYIKNKSGGDYAKGVGVHLKYKGEKVNINNGVTLEALNAHSSNVFYFTAYLGRAGDEDVTAGKVDTNVTVSVTYN
ncbi:fimbrial protein [Escherichia coli]|uniref:fimbrial protein n=1 Tax=Escherichia coli TaxID=562 RepID=UPI000BE5032C|nr:fimbrial protein [Escherichia coli]